MKKLDSFQGISDLPGLSIECFTYHTLGSSFCVVNSIIKSGDLGSLLTRAIVHHLSKNMSGVDGFLFFSESRSCDVKMLVLDCFGAEIPVCGNGMRCLAAYFFDRTHPQRSKYLIETNGRSGLVEVLPSNTALLTVKASMGIPSFDADKVPIKSRYKTVIDKNFRTERWSGEITALSLGNPHVVILEDDFTPLKIKQIGSDIESDSRFPERTNIEFVRILSRSEIEIRIWERSVGISQACTSASCAAVVATHTLGLTDNQVLVKMPGGDIDVFINQSNGEVFHTGTVALSHQLD